MNSSGMTLSSQDHQIHPPRSVVELAERLEKAGFETWCVGGAVRDALLGLRNLDWDLATAATPEQVRAIFRRTVPVGIEFGTVGVFDREGRMHEVTTFRLDVRTDGRHAEVRFGASLDEDLARRDFTINSVAYSPTRGRVHDPFGGREDLAAGLVRAVGDPGARMREDRLRALRAIRFSARFGFAVDPATWAAVEESAPHLGRLSAERVKQELEKTMDQVPRAGDAIALWARSGALATLIPGLAQPSWVTVGSLNRLCLPGRVSRPQRRINRLTALVTELGEGAARRTLRDLRFSKADVNWIAAAVGALGQVEEPAIAALSSRTPPSDVEVRRWVSAIGRTRTPAVMRVLAARVATLAAGEAPPAIVPARASGGVLDQESTGPALRSLYRRSVRSAFRDAVEISDLALDGTDLAKVGLSGPRVGECLRALLRAVIEDQNINTRESLLEIVSRDCGAARGKSDSGER